MSLEFGKLNFYTSFNPASAFPLDARSYFESYDAAVAAAEAAKEVGDSTTIYYYGQTVAVVEAGVATLYTIQPDNTLAEVGGKIEVNENAFVLDENGVLDLYGFADAVAGAQLMKVDGKLAWIKPDQTTVEGLQATVEGLVQRVEAAEGNIDTLEGRADVLEGYVGVPAEGETAATGLFAEVGKKANAADVYTIEQADSAIATAVAGAAHLQRTKVESVDAIQVGAEGADKFIYMVAKDGVDGDHYDEYMVIDGAVERVGDWAVDLSEYAKTADVEDALDGKVDVAEGERLMTDAEGTKLEGIEAGAEVNVIASVDEEQFAIDENRNLTLLDITMGKVTGLADALAGKVDVAEGERLMTDAEGTKLEGIEAGAQVNLIDTIDETQFAVDGKNLTLLDIAMGKVTGLADALAGKVDAVDGERLMTDAEGTKLEGIEAGAQANKIETVDESQFAIDADKNLTLLDIAMGKVTGLSDALAGKVDAVEGKGLSTNDLTDELLEKLNVADTNVIEIVKVNGTALQVADDKSVDIIIPETPIATAEVAGVVKSAEGENKVSVAEDGTMEVNSVNVNKLVQTEGDVLIFNGGAADTFK